MASRSEVVFEDQLHVPLGIRSLDHFRSWTHSEGFPARGRIDYLDGAIEVDMSPEDLYTHGIVKSAIAGALHAVVTVADRGNLFIDRTRVSSPIAGLSAEPDIVVVLWPTLDDGRVREVPSRGGKPGRFVELEGAPDLVVEIVSDSSEHKDLERLPSRYALAGVPELWTVDARGERLRFDVHTLETLAGSSSYRIAPPDRSGWSSSPALGRNVRLVRTSGHGGRPRYALEVGAAR